MTATSQSDRGGALPPLNPRNSTPLSGVSLWRSRFATPAVSRVCKRHAFGLVGKLTIDRPYCIMRGRE